MAAILVTHDFGIVAANADRVAVMYAGKIVEIGTTLQIFDDPRHPYTRALLRCLPAAWTGSGSTVEIGGQPPDLARLPAGLPLRAPLPAARGHLRAGVPARLSRWPGGHVAHCWAAARAGAAA